MALGSLRRRLRFLPLEGKLALVVAVFGFIVVALVFLAALEMRVLDAVRAYVTGEGFWSKGEKTAVYQLQRYAVTRDEADYRAFRTAVAVPLGDHRARVALDRPDPDRAAAREGFLAGRNHLADVDGLIELFLRFRNVSYMAKAVEVWAAADVHILELERLGERLHAAVQAGASPEEIKPILEAVDGVDRAVSPLADEFSVQLGEGARWVHRLMLTLIVAAGLLLVCLGAIVSWMLVRHVRAGERRYRDLLDTANDAILVSDAATGVVLEANQRASALLRRPLPELVGTPVAELGLADPGAPDGARPSASRAGTFAAELRAGDGSTVPVEVSCARAVLGGRSVVHSIVRDVTLRRDVEQALRASEERYRTLFEDAPDPAFVHDLDGVLLDVNRAAEELTGYRRDEVRGMRLCDVIAPEHVDPARRTIELARNGAASTTCELDVIARDGRRVAVEVCSRAILDGGRPVALHGVARDVGARRRAEAAAEESRRRLEEEARGSSALARVAGELLESFAAPDWCDALCRLSAEALGCDASHAWLPEPHGEAFVACASFGRSPEDGAARRALRPSREALAPLLDRLARDAALLVGPGEVDALGLGAASGGAPLGCGVYAALRRGDEVVGFLSAHRDPARELATSKLRLAQGIGRLASLAFQHAQVLAGLERASRVKSEFVAALSHELRSPLDAIAGYADMLLAGVSRPLGAEQEDAVRRIEHAADELSEIVSSTLDMSRLEAGQVRLEPELVHVRELLDEMALAVPLPRDKTGLALEWRAEGEVPPLYTDRLKLEVVLRNVVRNGIKLTHSGGITVTACAARGGVEFRVRDTGIGIPGEQRELLFAALRQGGLDGAGAPGGVGLGLYIAERLVAMLGGTIGVESAPGEGSTFRVWLPAVLAAHRHAA